MDRGTRSLASFLVLLLAGCHPDCRLGDVPSVLTIHLAPPLDEGLWEIELHDAVLERTLACEISVPRFSGRLDCGFDLTPRWEELDVAGLEASSFAPDVVEVQLDRDGGFAGFYTLAPDYDEYEPNGEGCGVVRTAEVTLVR